MVRGEFDGVSASSGPGGESGFQTAGFLSEFMSLSRFLEHQDSLERSLGELAAMAAHLLRARTCSIMLLKDDAASGKPTLRVCAHHGELPAAAYEQVLGPREGIAGLVASDARPLLIQDIGNSAYASISRRGAQQRGAFISAPILVDDRVIGVLNVCDPTDRRTLDQADLNLTTIVALMVGKSIQVFQLQRLLHSNLVQMALAREMRGTPVASTTAIVRDGARLARILGKSFFGEMRSAGFGTDQILEAATEIISRLGQDLDRHRHQPASQAG